MPLPTPVAEEHVAHLPRHVERRQQRAAHQHIKGPVPQVPVLRRFQNAVLRPEAGEQQRKTTKRQHAHRIRNKGQRHIALQSAHPAHVLFLVAAVDHRTRAHKEQRLEERVRNQVEHAHRHAAHAQARHHVTQLRNRRISQNTFDIVLRDCDQRGKQRRGRAHPRHHRQRNRRAARQRARLHQRIHASNEINSRRHHRRCVNQRRNWRRAFHRVRQPDMQRQLAALARCTGKDQQPNRSCRCESKPRRRSQQPSQRSGLHRTRTAVIEQQRTRLAEQPHHAQQKEDVADARGQESFLRCRRRRGLLIPEPDQKIRGEAHQLPAHEQKQQAVRDHHAKHRARKQREKTEEACEVFVVLHVADGVDEDQQADKRDHHQHHGRKRIEHPAQVHVRPARVQPRKVHRLPHRLAMHPSRQHMRKSHQRQHQRAGQRANRK